MKNQIRHQPHDLDFTLLKSFVAVVECGGFTAAAARIHRTQSTISQQIRRLERQFGTPLLERSSAGVTLTAAGEQVLNHGRRILALSGELADTIAGQKTSTTLRLGITDDYAWLHLSALLTRIARVLPGIQLHVTCALSMQLRRGLSQGEYDLVIYKRTVREGEGKLIMREPMRWVAAKTFRASNDEVLPLVLLPLGCVYRQKALASLDSASRRWRLAFESPSTASVQAAVSAGMGITVLTPTSLPKGCNLIELSLAPLGNAELVYEFGLGAPPQAQSLLREVITLARA